METNLLVCVTKKNYPEPPPFPTANAAVLEKCTTCGEEVWRQNEYGSSGPVLANGGDIIEETLPIDAKIVCPWCAVDYAREHSDLMQAMMLEEQVIKLEGPRE